MSGVETLREAARLMRERAQRATPGPWAVSQLGLSHPRGVNVVQMGHDVRQDVVADCCGYQGGTTTADGTHIAALDPTVALAIADWLESVAGAQVSPDEDVLHAGRMIAHIDEDAALAVANAYLRTTP